MGIDCAQYTFQTNAMIKILSTLGLEYRFKKGLKPDAVSDKPILLEEEHGNTEKNMVKCEGHMQNRGTEQR